MPMNSMPTISSDVAIGYRMNGSEMLSAMIRAPCGRRRGRRRDGEGVADGVTAAGDGTGSAPLQASAGNIVSGGADAGEGAGVGAVVGCTSAPCRNRYCPQSRRFHRATDPV